MVASLQALGIPTGTHYRWIHRGIRDGSGRYFDYHQACEAARNTARLAHRDKLEHVVFTRAETPHERKRITYSRLMRVPRADQERVDKALEDYPKIAELFEAEGLLYKEEVQRTDYVPDAPLALKVLERIDRANWFPHEDQGIGTLDTGLPDPNRVMSAWLDELFGFTEPEEQCNYFVKAGILPPDTDTNIDIANAIATAKHPHIVVSGPVGTGKTVLILLILHGLCMRFPGFKILCLRNEASTLKGTLFDIFKQVLHYGFAKTGDNPLNAYGGEVNPSELQYQNGSVIHFRGLDDPGKVKTGFFNVVFFNELQRYHNEQGVTDLTGRLRGNQVGWDRENGEQRVLQLADCNPGHPRHLIKRLEEEKRLTLYPTTLEDNAAYFKRGKWTTEGQRYRTMLETQYPKGSVSYLRDVLGLWIAAEGIVFNNFDEKRHVRAIVPADVPSDWQFVSALDYGYSVCAYGLFAHPPDIPDRVWGVGAIYKEKLTTDDLWEYIQQLHEYWNAPLNIVCHADHDKTQSETLRRKGLRVRNAKKTEYLARLDAVRRYLQIEDAFLFNSNMLFHVPDPGLKRRGECVEPLEEFSRFAYPTESSGNPERDDYPVKRFDHYMDVVSYLAASHMSQKQSKLIFRAVSHSAEDFGIV